MKPNHPLRVWREKEGLTGEQLGVLIGVSKFAISAYESGRRYPRRDVARRLREVTRGEITSEHFISVDGAEAGAAA